MKRGSGSQEFKGKPKTPQGSNRMKKKVIFVPFLFFLFLANGCVSNFFSNPGNPPDQTAFIQGSRYWQLYGVVIDSIDGQALSNTNSAYILPGHHRVQVTYYLAFSANYAQWVDFRAETSGSYIIKAEVQNQWRWAPSVYYIWIEEARTGKIVGGAPPSR